MPLLLDDGSRKYVWGAAGLAYEVEGTGNGTITVYHTDGLGSVRALTDASGAVVQTYETEEFGVPIAAGTQGSKTQPFGFTGEQRDAETGFSYLRARMYDPQVGRFLSEDPFAGFIGDPQSLNRYAYAGNNPINFTDPSGFARAAAHNGFGGFAAVPVPTLPLWRGPSVGAGITAGLAALAALLTGVLPLPGGGGGGPRPPGATPTPSGAQAVLDANALIDAIEHGETAAVDAALAGRRPLIPDTVERQFLGGGGDPLQLSSFLAPRHGGWTPDADRYSVADVQRRLAALNNTRPYGQRYVPSQTDLIIAATAEERHAVLITRDRQFLNWANAIGIPAYAY